MKYFSEVPDKAILAFKRFPLTILWVTLGSFFIITILGNDNVRLFQNYFAELYTLSLGVSWLIGAQFLTEYRRRLYSWVLKCILLSLLIFYYFSFPENSEDLNTTIYSRWLLLFFTGHVFVFFAPFVSHWDKTAYWNYLQKIIISIVRSLFFSSILYGGIALALLAIETLFNIDFPDKIYGQLFIFCLGIINTFIYLSDFPKEILSAKKLNYTKALDVFLKYILIPILALYIIIVYAYSLKIVFLWELPQGWVSYLISVLAIVGFIIQIIIEPVRKEHQAVIIRKFYPVFYWLLFPLVILFFLAIYIRIKAYNFTENRYLLCLLALWIFCVSIYLLISKRKKLSVLPISLFLLCIVAAFGPLSAFKIGPKAQLAELKFLIEKTKNGKNLISTEEAHRIESISTYLKRRDKLYLLDKELGFSTDYEKYAYSSGEYILECLYGKKQTAKLLRPDVEPNRNHTKRYYFSINKNQTIDFPLKDFDQFIKISLNNSSSQESNFKLNIEEEQLLFQKDDKLLFQFNIHKIVRDLISNEQDPYSRNTISPEKLTQTIENNYGKFILLIDYMNIKDDKNENISIKNLNASIFINYKQE